MMLHAEVLGLNLSTQEKENETNNTERKAKKDDPIKDNQTNSLKQN